MALKSNFVIGLIGNPNVGKSTLFNNLTGARQQVGNWPGKTVEKKVGFLWWQGQKIKVVDLPGTYSLTAFTEEEIVVSDFIKSEKPDAIIQILDAQNLARNLFLTLQLIELRVPLILAINMLDLANKDGVNLDIAKLSEELDLPVIVINARKKIGLSNFLRETIDYLRLKSTEEQKNKFNKYMAANTRNASNVAHRYGLIKILEKQVVKRDQIIANRRWSRRLDDLVMHKYLGIPFLLGTTWFIFQITFKFSAPLTRWIELFFSFASAQMVTFLHNLGMSSWFISLISKGIVGGVGSVLLFVPSIGILFLLISILEDTGYMSRVACVMDRLMHRLGLHGKAFIPLVIGFGCNVPGIMATRTLETKRDRLLTILISPFISCSARLPVYVLFAGIFFNQHQGLIIASLYILSIVIAIIMGLLFKRIFSKGLSTELIIELPPYRLPTLRGLFLHIWEKVEAFVKKAGSVILAFSLIVWLMASLPVGVDYGSRESLTGALGQAVAPIFAPLGFDNWQSAVALTFGMVAKEVIVSTFGALHGVSNVTETDPGLLSVALQQYFTPLSAYAFMVFVLLYSPCGATMAIIRKETGSIKWALFVLSYTLTVAYIAALLVYQIGKLIGFN